MQTDFDKDLLAYFTDDEYLRDAFSASVAAPETIAKTPRCINPLSLVRRRTNMNIEDRYEVIDAAHGEGGYGRISKRRDKVLDRFVAVKQLRMLDNPEARERFKREAKALARMSHPNVPAIYDVQFDEREMPLMSFLPERSGHI